MTPVANLEEPTTIAAPDDALNLTQLERDCASYLRYRRDEADAKADADALKVKIVAQCKLHGKVPENAPKSFRIETPDHIATITISTTMEIDDQICGELQQTLKDARRSKLFPLLFTERREYSLAPSARKTMKSTKWPVQFADQIKQLYFLCFDAKSNNPSLSVDNRKEMEERKRKAEAEAAEKLEAAAAKKAAKKAVR